MNASLEEILKVAKWLREHQQHIAAARLELACENLRIDLASIDSLEEKYESLHKRLDALEKAVAQ